jgi:hypothetical protein
VQQASQYRDLAAQCVLMASNAATPEQKAALLGMAQRWIELAEHVENAETQTNGKGGR